MMHHFIETHILKKRLIVDYGVFAPGPDQCVEILDMAERPALDRYDPLPGALTALLARRAGSRSWVLFLLTEDRTIVGYAFLHRPSATEWLDSLPTLAGEARSCSHFTTPEARGRGVIGRLLSAQRAYLGNQARMWAVIECSNSASVAAAMKSGQVSRHNYLVKFARRNVLSITTRPLRIRLLIGRRRASR